MLVLFHAGNNEFGIDMSKVQSIQPGSAITGRMDGAQATVELDGGPLPLCDLAALTGGATIRRDRAGRRLLLVNVQGRTTALLVDRVNGVIEEKNDRIMPLPPIFKHTSRRLFPSVLCRDDSLVLLLDPAGIADHVRTPEIIPQPADREESSPQPDPSATAATAPAFSAMPTAVPSSEPEIDDWFGSTDTTEDVAKHDRVTADTASLIHPFFEEHKEEPFEAMHPAEAAAEDAPATGPSELIDEAPAAPAFAGPERTADDGPDLEQNPPELEMQPAAATTGAVMVEPAAPLLPAVTAGAEDFPDQARLADPESVVCAPQPDVEEPTAAFDLADLASQGSLLEDESRPVPPDPEPDATKPAAVEYVAPLEDLTMLRKEPLVFSEELAATTTDHETLVFLELEESLNITLGEEEDNASEFLIAEETLPAENGNPIGTEMELRELGPDDLIKESFFTRLCNRMKERKLRKRSAKRRIINN